MRRSPLRLPVHHERPDGPAAATFRHRPTKRFRWSPPTGGGVPAALITPVHVRNQYRGGVTHPPRRAVRPVDASVLLAVRGVPSWGAVIIAAVLGIVGIIVDRAANSAAIGWGFGICFSLGIALAVLAVRRGSIFTGMVQAPILLAILVFVAYRVFTSEGTIFSASKIVTNFPTMAVATGVGLLLGLVRIIAQPAHSRSAPRSAGRTAARA